MKRLLGLTALVAFSILSLCGCGAKAAASVPFVKVKCPAGAPMVRHPDKAAWDALPAIKINPAFSWTACIQTTAGNIVVNLMPKAAKKSVNAFIILANHKYYDGGSFDRVIKNYLIQGGQKHAPAFTLPVENAGNNFLSSTVALAHSANGSDSDVGQFFICQGSRCAQLDGSGAHGRVGYAVIGSVSSGMKVVDNIAKSPVRHGSSSTPQDVVRIKAIRIYNSYNPPYSISNDSGS